MKIFSPDLNNISVLPRKAYISFLCTRGCRDSGKLDWPTWYTEKVCNKKYVNNYQLATLPCKTYACLGLSEENGTQFLAPELVTFKSPKRDPEACSSTRKSMQYIS